MLGRRGKLLGKIETKRLGRSEPRGWNAFGSNLGISV